MFELYLLITLATAGYFFNQLKPGQTQPIKHKVNVNDTPSMDNIYKSNYTQVVKKVEEKKAEKMHAEVTQRTENKPSVVRDGVYSRLAGTNIESFQHNNMTPFYRGSLKNNIKGDMRHPVFEHYTGANEFDVRKTEQKPFFTPQKDVGNVFGMANNTHIERDRIVVSKIHNNVGPVPQIRVGPGIGLGYDAQPKGGFGQFEIRDYVIPKDTDELRVKNNPKMSYEGRTVEGQKGSMPGELGQVFKHIKSTVKEQSHDDLFRTTGAYLKPAHKPAIHVKCTNRIDTSREYHGQPFNKSALPIRSDIKAPSKTQYTKTYTTQENRTHAGLGDKYDYGKATIQIYSNERDITSTRTHQGNVTSMIKALIAPFEDVMKGTRKEESVESKQGQGNIQPQLPPKPTTFDPNNVAKTTIKETVMYSDVGIVKGALKLTAYDTSNKLKTTNKETLVHDNDCAIGLKGPVKITVFDRNDLTRTTTKQTTLQGDIMTSLKGPTKGTIYDRNDVTRTTVKETTLGANNPIGLKGSVKGKVFDPNDSTRVTIKETTLNGPQTAGLKGHVQLPIYDDNDIAKVTIKETLLQEDPVTGLKGAYKTQVYDPDNVTRTTIRETTIDAGDMIGLKGHQHTTVYDPNETTRTTIKQTTLSEARVANIQGNVKQSLQNDDITRTTIKQTTLSEARTANIQGNVKQTLQNDDVARTTIKETQHQETQPSNIKGASKVIVYDPNSILRTTTKQTTLQPTENCNLSGHSAGVAKDPNDIARTTTKETLLQETQGFIKGREREKQYNKDEKARCTLRQTLENEDYHTNFKGKVAPLVYDPDQVAKTTIRETNQVRDYEGPIFEKRDDGYQIANVDMKSTEREQFADCEYMGQPAQGASDAYKVLKVVAKNTQKEELTDNDYYGHASSMQEKKTMSYENIYNSTIDELKESTLKGREPTQTGTKVWNGQDFISMQTRKEDDINFNSYDFETSDRITNIPHDAKNIGVFTRDPMDTHVNNRIDADLLTTFNENPFTQPLDSVA